MSGAGERRWGVDVPSGWVLHRGDDVVVAAAPGPHRGVTAHVLVGHERVRSTLDLGTVARHAIASLATGASEVDELGSVRKVLDGIERHVSVATCVPRGAGVEVAQLLALVGSTTPAADGRRDVVQVVGTCSFDELDRYGGPFAAVVESVRLRPPSRG